VISEGGKRGEESASTLVVIAKTQHEPREEPLKATVKRRRAEMLR